MIHTKLEVIGDLALGSLIRCGVSLFFKMFLFFKSIYYT